MLKAREFYLTFIFVLMNCFLGLSIYNALPADIWLGIILGLMVIVSLYYQTVSHRPKLLTWHNSCPIAIIFASIAFSMVTVNIYYGQSFLTSLLTYKAQYLMFGIIMLLIMRPTERELIKSLKFYSILYTFFYILRLLIPSLFIKSVQYTGENEVALAGYELLSIYFCYVAACYRNKNNLKNCLIFLWLLVIIVLQQNRSIMLPTLLISLYVVWSMRSRYTGIIVMLFAVMAGIVFISTIDTWIELYNQTINELGNPKYNRNLALEYFLHKASPNIICDIFGNGFLSNHTSKLMAIMMDKGIYNTDMGFLGYWNQFGIIPIVVFLYMIIVSLKNKSYLLYERFLAFEILLCSMTIMYFGQMEKISCFMVFYYLFTLSRLPIHLKTRYLNLSFRKNES